MDFSKKVYQWVKKIPRGKVATYGQIAARLGNPGAARAVGNALQRNPDPRNIPCHRVVNREGKLARNFGIGGWKEQKKKLQAERVSFRDKDRVDLERYLWKHKKLFHTRCVIPIDI